MAGISCAYRCAIGKNNCCGLWVYHYCKGMSFEFDGVTFAACEELAESFVAEFGNADSVPSVAVSERVAERFNVERGSADEVELSSWVFQFAQDS